VLIQRQVRGFLQYKALIELCLYQQTAPIVQRKWRVLLARRRASTSVAASSGCSTHTPKPPSGQVDRLTTAAEESNADKSSTAQPEKTARRSRKRGGRSKAKDLTAELDSAAPQQQTTPITDYIALPLLFGEMRPMPDFPAAKLPVLG